MIISIAQTMPNKKTAIENTFSHFYIITLTIKVKISLPENKLLHSHASIYIV